MTGQDGEQLLGMITAQAEDAVRKDFALEAVADAEAIEVSDEMVEEWIREQSLSKARKVPMKRSSG